MKFFRIILFSSFLNIIKAQQCDEEFEPPDECFTLQEIEEYAVTANAIETLYEDYVNLLTDARFTIDGDEAGVNLFFGGDLPPKIQKLKHYGNSIVSFLEIALHHYCREYGLTGQQLFYCLEQLNVTADYFDICEKPETVNCSKRMTDYQPIDGICANSNFPFRGAINTPYRRLIKNGFDDSIHEIRKSAHDNDLPSARLVSSGLRTLYFPATYDSPDNMINDFALVYVSQVIQDISKTLKAQTWDGNFGFECCECGGTTKVSQRFFNRHCMPIEVPERDKIFQGHKCMNYIRAMVTHDDCQLKEASVLNAATHFLDMDFIYGPETIGDAVKNGGKFKDSETEIHKTIVLGDERSAQFPQLYALAVVWIKFHNFVADELIKLYPDLPANVIFFETRRFVIAVYQRILYSEVLPLFIGSKSLSKYRLMSRKPCYDANIDPSVTAEFTASAARYLHTFVPNDFVVNFKNGTKANILLRHLVDENLGYNELVGVITGLLERQYNTLDIAKEPSNYLFSRNGEPGLDLRALDIQTERDFGIATYCDALYHFNLTKECIGNFSSFEPAITSDDIDFLKYAYEEPCDVDLGVGASLQTTEDGNMLSTIFDQIFAIQFKNLKCGDPYFYSNAFPQDQLNIILPFTFFDVLCLTVPDLPNVQEFVFSTPGANNTKKACDSVFSLKRWKLSPNYNNTFVHLNPDDDDSETFFIFPDEDDDDKSIGDDKSIEDEQPTEDEKPIEESVSAAEDSAVDIE